MLSRCFQHVSTITSLQAGMEGMSRTCATIKKLFHPKPASIRCISIAFRAFVDLEIKKASEVHHLRGCRYAWGRRPWKKPCLQEKLLYFE